MEPTGTQFGGHMDRQMDGWTLLEHYIRTVLFAKTIFKTRFKFYFEKFSNNLSLINGQSL